MIHQHLPARDTHESPTRLREDPEFDSGHWWHLPLGDGTARRDWTSLFSYVPSSVPSGLGNEIASGGATGTENLYEIDGLTVSDPVTGETGVLLSPFLISDVTAVPFGAEAGQGASTGLFVSARTHSYSNDFHADLFSWGTGGSLAAGTRPTLDAPSARTREAYEVGALVSGPLVKDRLWFSVGLFRSWQDSETSGAVLLNDHQREVQRWFSREGGASVRSWSHALQFSWRPSERQHVSLSLFGDEGNERRDIGPYPSFSPEAQASEETRKSRNMVLRWDANLTDRLFFTILAGMTQLDLERQPLNERGSSGQTRLAISHDWDMPVAVTPGFGHRSRDQRDTDQFRAELYWSGRRNEVILGAQLERRRWRRKEALSGRVFSDVWLRHLDTGPTLPWRYLWSHAIILGDLDTRVRGYYGALFVQDRFAVTDYLIVKAGARYEINAVGAERGNSLRLPSLSPRLGFAWDFAHNGKSKLYGSWGRYFERLPLAMGSPMQDDHRTRIYYAPSDPGVRRDIRDYIPADALPGIKNQSQDEAVLGLMYEVASDCALGGRVVYRNLNRALETAWYVTSGPGGHAYNRVFLNPGYQWTPLLTHWWPPADLAPFPRPIRRYTALELNADKRWSGRWMLKASFVLSRLRGNTSGGYDPTLTLSRLSGHWDGGYGPAGQNEPTPHMTGDWDWPERNPHIYGALPTDRPRQFRLLAAWAPADGWILSCAGRFDSGAPHSSLDRKVGYGISGYSFSAPRGSAGRLPSSLAIHLRAERNWLLQNSTLSLFAELYNATNQQAPLRTDDLAGTWRRVIVNQRWIWRFYPNRFHGEAYERLPPRALAFGIRWSY